MKLAVTKCYGGFSLSEKAMRRFAELMSRRRAGFEPAQAGDVDDRKVGGRAHGW